MRHKAHKFIVFKLSHTLCRIHRICYHKLLNSVFSELFAAQRVRLNKTVGTGKNNVVLVQLYLLYRNIRRNVVYKAKNMTASLNFNDVIVRLCIKEHRRNTAVYIVHSIIFKINDCKHTGKNRTFLQIIADKFIYFYDKLLKVVRFLKICADNRLKDDHTHTCRNTLTA